jgi:hypothetical protein
MIIGLIWKNRAINKASKHLEQEVTSKKPGDDVTFRAQVFPGIVTPRDGHERVPKFFRGRLTPRAHVNDGGQ